MVLIDLGGCQAGEGISLMVKNKPFDSSLFWLTLYSVIRNESINLAVITQLDL